MLRWLQFFSLALLSLFGLIACSSTADTQQAAVNNVAQTRPTVTPFPTPAPPTIEVGRPAFLTSYADW
jgi:hypothetical protein